MKFRLIILLSNFVRYLCSTERRAGRGSSPLAWEKDMSCFQDADRKKKEREGEKSTKKMEIGRDIREVKEMKRRFE